MKAWQNYKRFFKVMTAGFAVLALVFVADPVNATAAAALGEAVTSGIAASGNVILNLVARIIIEIANFVGAGVMMVLELILLPIIQYSDFIGHPVVIRGWSIVRDLMNTGFIVLMLIIAFGTMFGISRMNWTQQIPKLVIAAIAINFSRLITGLFIDIGQVIMIGFVNALQQVGVGNFLQLLKLQTFQTQVGGSITVGGASNLGSAMMALVMTAIVLVVILLIAFVLVYRIVILWVLIIMSPAAFLAGAAKDMLSQAGGIYTKWWGKLTAAVMIGPILTFFLWLALASVDGMTQGFDTNRNPPPSGSVITNSIVTNDNLTGFVIGIALLLAGLEISTSVAGTLGGAAGKAVGYASSVSKKLAAAPLALAGTATLAAGRQGIRGARYAGASVAGGASSLYRGATQERRVAQRESARAKAEARIGRGGVFGAVHAARGRRGLAKVGEEEKKEKSIQSDLSKKYAGFGKTMGDQQKKDFIAKNTGRFATEEQRAQAMALSSGMVSNKTEFADMMRRDSTGASKMLNDVQDHQKLVGDEKGQEKMAKMLAQNPQWANANPEDLGSALAGMSQSELAGIDALAWEDSNFREAARSSGQFDDMFSSKSDIKNNARKGFNKKFIDAAGRHRGPGSTATAAKDSVEQKRYQRELDLQRGLDMDNPINKDASNSNSAVHRLVNANISGTMGANLGAGGMNLQNIDWKALTKSGDKNAQREIGNAIDDALSRKGSSGMIQSLQQATKSTNTEEKARAEMMMRVVQNRISTADKPGSGKTIHASSRVAAGGSSATGYGYGTSSASASNQFGGGSTEAVNAAERKFAAALGASPSIIVDLDAEMSDMDGGMARVAAESTTKAQLDGMMASWQKSQGSDMEAIQKKALEKYGKLLKDYDSKIKESSSGATAAVKKQVAESLRHFDARIKGQLG